MVVYNGKRSFLNGLIWGVPQTHHLRKHPYMQNVKFYRNTKPMDDSHSSHGVGCNFFTQFFVKIRTNGETRMRVSTKNSNEFPSHHAKLKGQINAKLHILLDTLLLGSLFGFIWIQIMYTYRFCDEWPATLWSVWFFWGRFWSMWDSAELCRGKTMGFHGVTSGERKEQASFGDV